jgi:hypothetical protein
MGELQRGSVRCHRVAGQHLPEGGIGLQPSPGTRERGLAIIAPDGLSTQRQFFRQESRYLGLEVRFDLRPPHLRQAAVSHRFVG